MATGKPCKDCGSVTRKVTAPGPRCATCHRTRKAEVKKATHEAYVLKTYGLRAGEYDELLEAQGGACFICQRATGKTKRLAVDHDHKSGLVRGILCGPCNSVLAHIRDDKAIAGRIVSYLWYPPALKVLGERKPSE